MCEVYDGMVTDKLCNGLANDEIMKSKMENQNKIKILMLMKHNYLLKLQQSYINLCFGYLCFFYYYVIDVLLI